jgi:hypothetical protein
VDAKALTVSSYSTRVAYTALDATINAAVRDAQRQCERGYYCAQGRKRICPAGRYGDKVGETSPQVRQVAAYCSFSQCSLAH